MYFQYYPGFLFCAIFYGLWHLRKINLTPKNKKHRKYWNVSIHCSYWLSLCFFNIIFNGILTFYFVAILTWKTFTVLKLNLMHEHTSLPALLLCKLILAWMSLDRFSLESRNFFEKCSPKSTLWLHPPHSQFLTFPRRLMSHPQDFNFPRLHATATWWTTPAADIA